MGVQKKFFFNFQQQLDWEWAIRSNFPLYSFSYKQKEKKNKLSICISSQCCLFLFVFLLPHIYLKKTSIHNLTIRNEFMVTNANNESILLSRVGVFALGYTAKTLKVQEHLMENGYCCVIWDMFLFQLPG